MLQNPSQSPDGRAAETDAAIAKECSSAAGPGAGRGIVALRRRVLDRFVLRPSRHSLPFEPKRRQFVSCRDRRIECFVQRYPAAADNGQPPELLVLKFPGTAGRAERSSELPGPYLPEVRSEIWTWNPPGYGGSSGRASLSVMSQAAEQWLAQMTAGLDPERTRVWLMANSLGCVAATYLAAHHGDRIDALLIRNPPPLVQVVKRVARRYPLGFLTDRIAESVPPEMDLMSTASRAAVPALLLQSQRDDLVPPELQHQVYQRLPGPKRIYVMEGLAHDGIPSETQSRDIAGHVQWLWQHGRE